MSDLSDDLSEASDPDEERLVETGDLRAPSEEPDEERPLDVGADDEVLVPDAERLVDPGSAGESLDYPEGPLEPTITG